MKKRLLTLFCLVATVLLAACGVKKVDAGESIKTTFTGLDTKGVTIKKPGLAFLEGIRNCQENLQKSKKLGII